MISLKNTILTSIQIIQITSKKLTFLGKSYLISKKGPFMINKWDHLKNLWKTNITICTNNHIPKIHTPKNNIQIIMNIIIIINNTKITTIMILNNSLTPHNQTIATLLIFYCGFTLFYLLSSRHLHWKLYLNKRIKNNTSLPIINVVHVGISYGSRKCVSGNECVCKKKLSDEKNICTFMMKTLMMMKTTSVIFDFCLLYLDKFLKIRFV